MIQIGHFQVYLHKSIYLYIYVYIYTYIYIYVHMRIDSAGSFPDSWNSLGF